MAKSKIPRHKQPPAVKGTTPARSTPTANAAIFYHPEGYTTSADKLMGRHAAGEGFLNGFFRHAAVDCYYAYAAKQDHYEQFQQGASAVTGATRRTAWIPQSEPQRLSEVGALYLPGPDITPYAWVRHCHDPAAYSITGITHTICSDRIMDALGTLLLAPVEPWDAIICTSQVVKSSIERLLAGYGNHLAERLQAQVLDARIELPIIPLGVDCDAFAASTQIEEARQHLRKKFGIGAEDIVALFMGRFSYHAKAHPLPMYLGLEAAAQATGKKVWLIQAGWFPNEAIEAEFVNGARQLCPSVQMIFADGRKPVIRRNIWFAADLFISLSDNIQETFGITPIEAMAAGLPVVVTDWDGYRDTVEEGVTGFRIPTVMPAGCGEEIAYRFLTGADSYDRYIGYASQCIAVDVDATARALTELAGNAGLRSRMGEQGRARARKIYDWSVIIRQYQELWSELAVRRMSAKTTKRKPDPRTTPLRPDPFRLFSDYPTRAISADTVISLAVNNPEARLRQLLQMNMNRYAASFLLSSAECSALLKLLTGESQLTVKTLLEGHAVTRHAALQRTLAWLAKLGIVNLNG